MKDVIPEFKKWLSSASKTCSNVSKAFAWDKSIVIQSAVKAVIFYICYIVMSHAFFEGGWRMLVATILLFLFHTCKSSAGCSTPFSLRNQQQKNWIEFYDTFDDFYIIILFSLAGFEAHFVKEYYDDNGVVWGILLYILGFSAFCFKHRPSPKEGGTTSSSSVFLYEPSHENISEIPQSTLKDNVPVVSPDDNSKSKLSAIKDMFLSFFTDTDYVTFVYGGITLLMGKLLPVVWLFLYHISISNHSFMRKKKD